MATLKQIKKSVEMASRGVHDAIRNLKYLRQNSKGMDTRIDFILRQLYSAQITQYADRDEGLLPLEKIINSIEEW